MLEAWIEHFAYGRGPSQLSDVTMSLAPGRTVLLGPNGAGKTTLLKALAGITTFRGTLDVDGVSVNPRRARPRSYREAVGWLPQNVSPFPSLTAREHVAYIGWLKGMSPRAASINALDALARVGLDNRANEKADRLSGGQLRRLGIAGVLVHNARYLLLDEPTAGLDPRERDRLADVLRSVEETHAVLISTHDTAGLIDERSHIALLTAGSLAFTGSYRSFIAPHQAESEDAQLQLAYGSYVPED